MCSVPFVSELCLDALSRRAGAACSIFISHRENAASRDRSEMSSVWSLFPAKAQCVTHSFFFGPQVSERVWSWRNFAGKPRDNLDAVLAKAHSLARIVREQANTLDAEVAQDRGRQAEIPAIGLEPQRVIGLDRVDAGILQLVSLQLCHQADAAALLIFVNHEPATFLGDRLHGHLELVVAVAAQRPEHLAGEALRMDAQQRHAFGQFAEDDRERGFNPSVPFETSRSNPMASNIPHLVGMRVDAIRQSMPVCAVLIVSVLVPSIALETLRRAFLCFRNGAALAQAVDFARAEAQLLENRLVVLAKCRGALCRDFRNAMHIDGAADRRGELAARPFERNDDVVRAQLGIVDDFFRSAHDAERDVDAVEDLAPMRHRL